MTSATLHRIILTLIVCLITGLSAGAFTQDGGQTSSPEMVKLNVLVTDRDGNQVNDLRQEDFRVLDDGQPQKIESFFSGKAPISYALMIDTSGSMKRVFPEAIRAA